MDASRETNFLILPDLDSLKMSCGLLLRRRAGSSPTLLLASPRCLEAKRQLSSQPECHTGLASCPLQLVLRCTGPSCPSRRVLGKFYALSLPDPRGLENALATRSYLLTTGCYLGIDWFLSLTCPVDRWVYLALVSLMLHGPPPLCSTSLYVPAAKRFLQHCFRVRTSRQLRVDGLHSIRTDLAFGTGISVR